jgi:hypothetical protein
MSNSFHLYNFDYNTRFLIATTAIGGSYFENWEKYSKASWIHYALKFGIGIVVFTEDLISQDSSQHINGAWQKLLLPERIAKEFSSVKRVCLLDTDIVISPRAPNIFEQVQEGYFGVVSQEKQLPYPLIEVKKRIAYLRNKFYSSDYPLDSILFAAPRQIFRHCGLPEFDDYFCSGVLLMDISFKDVFTEGFHEARKKQVLNSDQLAWEEPYLNSLIQSYDNVSWLDYKFQTLWNYEMAWNYPFLYELSGELTSSDTAMHCIGASLWNSYFLHFAGSWHESSAWRTAELLPASKLILQHDEFEKYLNVVVTGLPKGKIVPVFLNPTN